MQYNYFYPEKQEFHIPSCGNLKLSSPRTYVLKTLIMKIYVFYLSLFS